MANKFNVNLSGRYLVLAQNVESATNAGIMSRLVKVIDGAGADPKARFGEVRCEFVANPARTGNDRFCIVSVDPTSQDVERLATQVEIEASKL